VVCTRRCLGDAVTSHVGMSRTFRTNYHAKG